MTWIILAVFAVAVLLLGGFFALRHWLNGLADHCRERNLLEQFDGGLAIPMRDSDSRRTTRRQP